MRENDNQLDRLFRAAAHAPQPESGTPAFKLEAQVMAGWRSLQPGEDMAILVAWFRKAIACGCLLMVLTLVWSYSGHGGNDRTADTSDAFSMTDSAVTLALNE